MALGRSWVALGRLLGALGQLLGLVGALGWLLGALGPLLDGSRAHLGRLGRQARLSWRVVCNEFKDSKDLALLRSNQPFWGLDGSWALLSGS